MPGVVVGARAKLLGGARAAARSLRNRFLALFLLIFLVGAGASYAVIAWFAGDLLATVGGWYAEKNVLYEKSKVLQLMLREITLTQKMASSPVLAAWVKDEQNAQARTRAIAELEDYRRFFRGQSYFFAIGSSGNYYFNDDEGGHDLHRPRYTLSSANDADQWFYATLEAVESFHLNVNTDRHLKVTKVWINTVLRDQGKPLAVIGTGVDLSDFIDNLISSTPPGVTNLLLDDDGAIQAHPDRSVIDFASIAKSAQQQAQSTVFNLISSPADIGALRQAMQELARGERDTRSLPLAIQGKRHIAAVTYVPEIRWFLVTLTRPESAAKRRLKAAAFLLLMATLGFTLLLAGFVFDRLVLRRLAVLSAAARAMDRGHYAVQPLPEGGDELGALARTFREMGKRIETHTAELENQAAALEGQVAERTRVLERMAHADELTGLLNRRGMLERLEIERSRMTRGASRLGLLLIDVDRLKAINDQHGHAAGDEALVRAATAIREAMRGYDLCARWGGDEFLVALPDLGSNEDLAAIGEKLRKAIGAVRFTAGGRPVALSASIGGSIASPLQMVEDMLRPADTALYAAKGAGRNRVVIAGG